MGEYRVGKDEPRILGLDDVLWFGKHKDKTVNEVINEAPGYLIWCINSGIFELDSDAEVMANDADENNRMKHQ